jgi:pumilio RNA-binding family
MQVKSLLYDVYGNYVILKCLDTVPKDRLSFILPAILDSIPYMVQQTYGCRILQKVMEVYPQEEVIHLHYLRSKK